MMTGKDNFELKSMKYMQNKKQLKNAGCAKLRQMRWAVAAVLATQLAACAVGPDYARPKMEAPAAFKEMNGWKLAQPRDNELRGNWWEIFNDPQLNALMEQVNISNQNLAQAEARFRQAHALVQAARAGYFPTLTGSASATRSGGSAGNQSLLTGNASTGTITTNHILSFDASWEADIWGRVRRTVESDEANAQASAADLQATRLSAQAQLAQAYFQLRSLDTQQQLFDRSVADYQRSVQLTQNQYAAGTVAKANVVLAQTQLKSTQAEAVDIGVQRAQTEHAIALLIGKAPADFSLPPMPLSVSMAVPVAPVGVPSALLERRPDIAAAERRVVSANAEIGVAKAAYFPALTISATGGYRSSSFANWLTLPNRVWSVGPQLAMTLFDAGARRAQTAQAVAAYDENVAAYRQTVLTGFQEVEDNLAALRILEQEAQMQDEAVQLARQSVALSINQYKAGIVDYLNVIATQTSALNNERTAVDVLNRRLAASVLLIKALGGGWNASALTDQATGIAANSAAGQNGKQ
jgi:NodT family efflux transporter outer membrane factor (OMF) lipoprotein